MAVGGLLGILVFLFAAYKYLKFKGLFGHSINTVEKVKEAIAHKPGMLTIVKNTLKEHNDVISDDVKVVKAKGN